MECIESIAKILFYIFAPLAAWVALFTWKRELKGKTKHDIAKDLLALIVRLRGFIYWAQIRSKMVSSRNNKMDNYKKLKEYLVQASELVVETSVHWGKEDAKLVSAITNRIIELDFAVSNYDPEDLIGEKMGVNKELVERYRKVIDGEDDEFNKETEKVFSTAENRFKKYVQ